MPIIFDASAAKALARTETAIVDPRQQDFSRRSPNRPAHGFWPPFPQPTMMQLLTCCIGAYLPWLKLLHTGIPVVNKLVFRFTGFGITGARMPRNPTANTGVPPMERLDLNRPVVDQTILL